MREALDPEAVEKAQHWEGKCGTVLMIIEGNVHIFDSLRSFYEELLENDAISFQEQCHSEIREFARFLKNLSANSNRHAARVKRLLKSASDKRTLVGHRNLN
jgi:hypothetical protein